MLLRCLWIGAVWIALDCEGNQCFFLCSGTPCVMGCVGVGILGEDFLSSFCLYYDSVVVFVSAHAKVVNTLFAHWGIAATSLWAAL